MLGPCHNTRHREERTGVRDEGLMWLVREGREAHGKDAASIYEIRVAGSNICNECRTFFMSAAVMEAAGAFTRL